MEIFKKFVLILYFESGKNEEFVVLVELLCYVVLIREVWLRSIKKV